MPDRPTQPPGVLAAVPYEPLTVVAAVPRLALSIDEACQALGISWDTWSEHVAPHVRIVRLGRRRLVPVAELEAWLADNAEALLEPRSRTPPRGQ
jgi:excisionase family DNA binding protein